MTGILLLTMALALSCSSFASAEIAPKEYERVSNQLGQALEFYRVLARPGVSFKDEDLLRRDPMRPLVDAAGNPVPGADLFDGPVLQGIIHSEGFTRALIDDKFYAAGDSFGPYTIREIRDEGIELEQGSSSIFIPLYQQPQPKKEKPPS